jgi:hypothetical protein
MAGAVTLIVILGAGPKRDPTTLAMAKAARDAMGDAIVDVRESDERSDDDAIALESSAGADAIVELHWSDSRRRRAILRIHIAARKQWVERSVDFKPTDAQIERGRTLGFSVASILAAADLEPETPLQPGETRRAAPPASVGSTPQARSGATPAAGPTSEQAPASEPTSAATPAPGAPLPAGPDTQLPAAEGEATPVSEERSSPLFLGQAHAALDLMALGSLGISGDASGVGGSAAVHWFPFDAVSLRIGGGVRAGPITTAHASTLVLSLTTGVAWHVRQASLASRLGLSIRLDYLLLDQAVTPDGSPQQAKSRTMSGIAGAMEVGWLLAGNADLLVGFGMEDVFFPTYLDLQGTRVATLPPLRAFGEIGGRLRF